MRIIFEVPNPTVAMNAWVRLACYPRGSLYPLSTGTSTCYQWVILSCFRNCSTCRSDSKAPLCQYTQSSISIGTEGTFEHFRYILESNRPSQTDHQTLFFYRITVKVRTKYTKGWYFTGDSIPADAKISKSPTYTTHPQTQFNAKFQ